MTTKGDVTTAPGVKQAIQAAVAANPGARSSSYFSTGSSTYVSKDRHTTFAEIYRPGIPGFGAVTGEKETRAALKSRATGRERARHRRRAADHRGRQRDNTGPSILGETLIGGFGALIILLFVFGTLPAVAMPLLIAIASILNTFTLVWLLTYITDVSIIVQFLIALVGLGVSIDYALLIIFRFREELRHGNSTDDAIVTTMQHAGRSVIVSGSTVAVGLLSMVLLPLPFIRSIGIGGMLIPAVSVLASITLLPAMLAMLGPRINRLRVMPKRLVEGSDQASGFWAWWSRLVTNHAALTGAIGVVIVAALLVPGVQLNPSESQAKDRPGGGDAIAGRNALERRAFGRCLQAVRHPRRGPGDEAGAPTRSRPPSRARRAWREPPRRLPGSAARRRSSRRFRPPTAQPRRRRTRSRACSTTCCPSSRRRRSSG